MVSISKLDNLKIACLDCKACSLGQTRKNLVFGVGNENTDLLFVGEGPGEQEDLQGEPFVGRAGKLLDDMLSMIGLDRTMIYIANTVKCRPPGNRDPKEEEQEACYHWLESQIDIINPKLIVCLGRISAMKLIKPDYKISKEHGQWFSVGGREITAIYHPAALLRDPRRRPETFDDLKEIQRKLKSLKDK